MMDRYRELNHHCRTPTKRFCELIQTKINKCPVSPHPQIYAKFLGAQRIYSFIKTQLELGNRDVCTPKRSVCPACEKNPDGIAYLAADGNLSFKGKGRPTNVTPLCGETYILNDRTADEIKNDKRYAKNCQKCSKYRADGTTFDSTRDSEDDKLWHRGLFGSICKHRVPGTFIFMTHGEEAYIYCNVLIHEALKKPWVRKLFAKYDIACNFKRYLKVYLAQFRCSTTD